MGRGSKPAGGNKPPSVTAPANPEKNSKRRAPPFGGDDPPGPKKGIPTKIRRGFKREMEFRNKQIKY